MMQPPCSSEQADTHPDQDDNKWKDEDEGEYERGSCQDEQGQPDMSNRLGLRFGE
jgi:hypothetical protein